MGYSEPPNLSGWPARSAKREHLRVLLTACIVVELCSCDFLTTRRHRVPSTAMEPTIEEGAIVQTKRLSPAESRFDSI